MKAIVLSTSSLLTLLVVSGASAGELLTTSAPIVHPLPIAVAPSCTNGLPDVTASGRYYDNPNVGSSYGSLGCEQEWVLQMNDVPPPSGGGGLTVEIQPSTPLTQALCTDTVAQIDLYGSNDGSTWTLVDSPQEPGTWETASPPLVPAGCTFGVDAVLGLAAASNANYTDYRVVASMILHQTNKGTPVDQTLAFSVNFQSLVLQ